MLKPGMNVSAHHELLNHQPKADSQILFLLNRNAHLRCSGGAQRTGFLLCADALEPPVELVDIVGLLASGLV